MTVTALSGPRGAPVSWGLAFLLLFIYRSVFSVLAELVVMQLTPISDTQLYQLGILEQNEGRDISLRAMLDWQGANLSTAITANLGGFFSQLFFANPILINIAFQAIAFVGIVYLLLSMDPKVRRRMTILLMLPSFTLWTSIASKEAIIVFCVCILMGYFVRMYYNEEKLGPHHLIAGVLLYIFKAHYFGAFAYAFVVTKLCRHVRQKALLALIIGLASLAPLYVFRYEIDELSHTVQWFITAGPVGRSTRIEPFFVEQFDVFIKAPLGTFVAFFGPDVTQMLTSPVHLLTFLESAGLLFALFYFVVRRLATLPLYNVIVGGFLLFWITFPNYPFGVMNPGSAIRYRSGWIVVVMVVFAFLMSRELFVSWRDNGRTRAGGARRVNRSVAPTSV